MSIRRLSRPIVLTSLAISFATVLATAEDYDYVDFTVPGAADTILNSINNQGRVAGAYGSNISPTQLLTSDWNGFVADSDGQNLLTLAPHPSAVSVEASAINNNGIVVGTYRDGSDFVHGFVFDGVDYQPIDVPFAGAHDTAVSNISDAGVVVGAYFEDLFGGLATTTFGFRATPKESGGYDYEKIDLGDGDPFSLTVSNTFLNDRNASFNEVASVRDQTLVVDPDTGELDTIDEVFGYLLTDSDGDVPSAQPTKIAKISYPDARFTRVVSINNGGMIAGNATIAIEIDDGNVEYSDIAYLVDAENLMSLPEQSVPYTFLNVPGSGSRFMEDQLGIEPNGHLAVQAINDQNAVVGYYDNGTGDYRGFVGIPVLSKAADFDGDGDVDSNDLTIWQGDFGHPGGDAGDADGDGDSDGVDFLLWQQQYEGIALLRSSHAVPEPADVFFLWGLTIVVSSMRRNTFEEMPRHRELRILCGPALPCSE